MKASYKELVLILMFVCIGVRLQLASTSVLLLLLPLLLLLLLLLPLLLLPLLPQVLIFSALTYMSEKDEPSSSFTSVIDAFWWAAITMTTVG